MNLRDVLHSQLNTIPSLAADEGLIVRLPDVDTVELSVEDLASLVARTSNTYGRLSRLAGMARANAKLAKGRYDYTVKSAKVDGKNESERRAKTAELASSVHEALIEAEALVQLVEGLENAARVASESARKIFDKVEAMYKAAQREDRGHYQEGDFTRW